MYITTWKKMYPKNIYTGQFQWKDLMKETDWSWQWKVPPFRDVMGWSVSRRNTEDPQGIMLLLPDTSKEYASQYALGKPYKEV